MASPGGVLFLREMASPGGVFYYMQLVTPSDVATAVKMLMII